MAANETEQLLRQSLESAKSAKSYATEWTQRNNFGANIRLAPGLVHSRMELDASEAFCQLASGTRSANSERRGTVLWNHMYSLRAAGPGVASAAALQHRLLAVSSCHRHDSRPLFAEGAR
jgi:hypothetical protein